MAITQKEPDKLKITPRDIYLLMQWPNRTMYGCPDYWEQLEQIAQELNQQVKPEDTQPILLSGWHRDGTYHGGYDYEEGEREVLGRGTLLYQEEIEHREIKNSPQTSSSCIIVEIWRTIINDQQKFVFLAFEYTAVDGYVGIDNHYGTDTTWKVSGIRILPEVPFYNS
ncbi:MAG: hypothetical protein ABIF17_03325 [Patescibacteria group bacterium]